jgi:hypothetical protein
MIHNINDLNIFENNSLVRKIINRVDFSNLKLIVERFNINDIDTLLKIFQKEEVFDRLSDIYFQNTRIFIETYNIKDL